MPVKPSASARSRRACIVYGLEAKILVVRECGVAVEFAGLGGVGEGQENLGPRRCQLLRLDKEVDCAGIIMERDVDAGEFHQSIDVVRLKFHRDFEGMQSAVVELRAGG